MNIKKEGVLTPLNLLLYYLLLLILLISITYYHSQGSCNHFNQASLYERTLSYKSHTRLGQSMGLTTEERNLANSSSELVLKASPWLIDAQ